MKSINDIEIAGLKLLKLLVYSMFYNVYGYKNDLTKNFDQFIG